MTWNQAYDPFGSMALSTLLAAVPVGLMVTLQAYVWPFTGLVIHH